MTTATRATLTGVGEHICAVLRLGDNYTDAEYIEAVTAAREAGAGELYADQVLGSDVEALIRGVEQDDAETLVRAAEATLRGRGVDPKTATYREYADALIEVSA
jgi:hypothetical protein